MYSSSWYISGLLLRPSFAGFFMAAARPAINAGSIRAAAQYMKVLLNLVTDSGEEASAAAMTAVAPEGGAGVASERFPDRAWAVLSSSARRLS
eukprot:CAMPEP_0194782966 /NCGR_PEP_ID=MMETSP0323_2-20130528/78968_1 /TAXON_ID=2866 ORGANISM="Crypthecodinium cohnii, Strain Seligo" /NCGR_SAMPLE_ID=MMETSP0323_2 /ASSEMBLY_ACC=CAM_ASM_000346 /LENGTH=92 /DNA_ID=CAMNT_0039721807 /DNA_START=707 /DNA_END=985 /DNA_ORIENTATION=+